MALTFRLSAARKLFRQPPGETKAVHMEAAASLPSADEEEEAGEGDDKRPARRKRRRRRGRGEQPFDPSLNGGSVPSIETESEEGDEDEDEVEIPTVQALAEAQSLARTGPLQNGMEGDTEGQVRRNRRRGRRGGRRHRDEGGAPEFARSQHPAHIPGLGEQPTIDLNHDFPKNLALGPISPRPTPPEREQVIQPEIEKAPTRS